MVKMKDSGIEWIGEIPEKWRVVPLYNYFSERKNKNRAGNERNLLSLSYGNIIRKNIEAKGGLLPESFTTYNVIEPGDIIIRPTDLQNDKRSLRTGLSNERGIITSAYIDLAPKSGANSRYYHYLLHSYDVQKVFYNMGNGVRQGLNYTEFSKLRVLVPERIEQSQITNFLDRKTTAIDRLIDKIYTEIDTLKQYQSSVITQAVTKGLDLNVPMKDSGIEWIGEIPETWKTRKIKYYLNRNDIKNHPDEEVLSVYRDYGVVPKDSRNDNHNVTSNDTANYKYVVKGNLVINKMKAWQGSMAVSNYTGIVSPAYYIYQFKNSSLNKRYFHYLIRNCYKDEFKRLSTGIRDGQWDLQSYDFENTIITLPSKDEQKRIADFVDVKISQIKKVIKFNQKQIKQLTEYKNSLIFEYVTGKKQVPQMEGRN